MPRTATGLWVVNSVGWVTVDGQDRLIAVVSKGGTTKAKGIALVETAARVTVSVFGAGNAEEEASSVAAASAASTTATS